MTWTDLEIASQYISREALIKAVEGNLYVTDSVKSYVRCTAKNIPAADVVKVVHGEWEPSDKYKGYVSCSVCHDCYVEPEWVSDLKWYYCPNCGAKMDGGVSNAAD